MNRILDALRTPSAMLVALLLALVAQLEHTAQVFMQIVSASGDGAQVHAYAFAVAVETAVLLFVLHGHRRISYGFAIATFATNLSYYAMHGVDLTSIAGAPAWLMAGLLPAAIVGYSHTIADAPHGATPTTNATVTRRRWQFWRKPQDETTTVNSASSAPKTPVAIPDAMTGHSNANVAAAVQPVESPKQAEPTSKPAPTLRKVGKTNEYGMTDKALAELLKVSRQRVSTMRNDGTLTTRVARELPQLERIHTNGTGAH